MFDKTRTLESFDPDIWQAIQDEGRRQEEHIELIASVKPRVVIAGVPTRKPLVIKGERGSLGTAFLLTVILARPRASSASLPVYSLPIKSTSIK